MKQYIKNIMILILALPWGLLLTNCSDSKSDYSDDNAYPPPTVELTYEISGSSQRPWN